MKLKKKILKTLAAASIYTAKAASNSASFWGMYQPKEPKMDKKKDK